MAGRILVRDLLAQDNNGAPIGGAKLYSFKTGGTVNQATYTTAALTVAHTNPVVADAYGRFPDIYAPSDLSYRIVVTDGSESSYAGATAINDTDPVLAQGGGVNPSPRTLTSTTALTSDDLNRDVYCSGTWALTIPLGAGLSAGWKTYPINTSTGTITLTCQGSDLVGGASTKTLGPYTSWIVEWSGSAWSAVEISAGTGKQKISIPAEAMTSRTTNGPGIGPTETSTNKVNLHTCDFDASTVEYAQFRITLPRGWDLGTITFVPIWMHGSTTTNFKVSWGLQAMALSDGDALDTAFGTAQYSNDTGGTTNNVYFGPESAAITVAGSPQAGDLVIFQVLRKADDVTNDTLAVDASLIGVDLYIRTSAGSDA